MKSEMSATLSAHVEIKYVGDKRDEHTLAVLSTNERKKKKRRLSDNNAKKYMRGK